MFRPSKACYCLDKQQVGLCGVLVDCLSRLLSEGFDLKYVDNHGQSLLDWAIVCGTWEIVELLCSRCEAKATFDLTAALTHAIAYGEVEVCRILLQYGADASAVARDGLRPMERVKKLMPRGHEKIMRLLQGR